MGLACIHDHETQHPLLLKLHDVAMSSAPNEELHDLANEELSNGSCMHASDPATKFHDHVLLADEPRTKSSPPLMASAQNVHHEPIRASRDRFLLSLAPASLQSARSLCTSDA